MPSDLVALVEERIASGDVELPVFPASAQEVLTLCDSPDVDAKKLANIIQRDASLAGHFLAIANSAAFRLGAPLVSLQQALTRLGTRQTKHVAIAVVCKTRAFVDREHPDRAATLLAHALSTALFAREIARSRRLNVEEAFLAGLLHDIGQPAIIQLCAETGADEDSTDECARLLHERVGGIIAESWSMRPSVVQAIAGHHSPVAKGMCAIVQLADALAHGERDLTKHPAADLLNLYPEDIEKLVGKVAEAA